MTADEESACLECAISCGAARAAEAKAGGERSSVNNRSRRAPSADTNAILVAHLLRVSTYAFVRADFLGRDS